MTNPRVLLARTLAAVASLATLSNSRADDWTNAGGGPGRNGLTGERGPDSAADVLWSLGRPSIIAWQPVISGSRVFTVRQTGFPPEPASDESPVVATDLDTGTELWSRNIPAASGDWTTWVAGASGGRVYVSRSGNGASVKAKLYGLDAATGGTLWTSADLIDAGAYDGVVFAPNGDPVVASFRDIWRIRATDGTTAWHATRLGSVTSTCGGAIHGDAIYVADAVPGGTAIKKFNLTTGALQYTSPTLAGFTIQNTPMVGTDGTIYLSRVQNNVTVDFFYAINDSGSAMTVRWSKPAQWTTESEFAVGPDGSVFMMDPGNRVARRSALDGSLLAISAAIPADFSQPRMAVDRDGRVFLSNGAFSNGRFYSFSPDLTERWSVAVPNINIGAPAVGRDGTLIVAGIDRLHAYRTPSCPADYDQDGFVTGDDFDAYVADFEAGNIEADFDGDGFVTGDDFDAFVIAFEAGC